MPQDTNMTPDDRENSIMLSNVLLRTFILDEGKPDFMCQLFECDPDIIPDVNEKDENGRTALMDLCSSSSAMLNDNRYYKREDNDKLFSLILSHTDDVNETDNNGETALNILAYLYKVYPTDELEEIRPKVEMLLEAGADLNISDNWKTPTEWPKPWASIEEQEKRIAKLETLVEEYTKEHNIGRNFNYWDGGR